MPPAWLGPSKCKRGVSGEALSDCPIFPWIMPKKQMNGEWVVTAYKCRECGLPFKKAFDKQSELSE